MSKKIILIVLLSVFCIGCVTTGSSNPETKRKTLKQYTTYNMWYNKNNRAYCINYQKGNILPIGTEITKVKLVKIDSDCGMLSTQYISFKAVALNKQFKVRHQRKFHPEVTMRGYLNLMVTTKTKDVLLEGMTTLETDAINRAIVVEGMSKKAVIASVGPPASHRTPYRTCNRWYYWLNHYNSRDICFNADNVVIRCTDMDNRKRGLLN